jgi:hypothetical protein
MDREGRSVGLKYFPFVIIIEVWLKHFDLKLSPE